MKKFVIVGIVIALLALCLCGCGPKGATLADVKAAGKIVAATSPDFPPFENLEDGQVVGIEADLAALVSEQLGVELEIVSMDFDSVLPGVEAGKYDFAFAGISVSPDRAKNTLFTTPYCLAAQSIVVKEGSPITCKADLTGKTVSVQTATTAEDFCLENGYSIQSYVANDDAKLALVSGKVDAWVIDDLTAAEMVALYNAENDDKLVILDEAMTTEPYAFAFAFGSEDLVAEIDTILKGLVADGTVKALFDKYGAPYTIPQP